MQYYYNITSCFLYIWNLASHPEKKTTYIPGEDFGILSYYNV